MGDMRIPIEIIHVRLLKHEAIKQFVAATLWTDEKVLPPVADMVFRKTAGNPFLVKALLTSHYDEGIVRFKFQSVRLGQPQIAALVAADDIGDLPARRIMQIPQDVRKTISLASALGQAFRMETLVTVCGLTVSEVYSHLITASQERVIFKDGEVYRFEHDRLREAAYSLLSADQRPDVHLRIGRLLARQQGVRSRTAFPFLISLPTLTGQLRSSKAKGARKSHSSQLDRRPEGWIREPPIQLPLSTFRKLSLSPRFECMGGPTYELSLALHTEGAETALLSLDFSSADRLVRLVHENARTTLDKIPAYEVQISASPRPASGAVRWEFDRGLEASWSKHTGESWPPCQIASGRV